MDVYTAIKTLQELVGRVVIPISDGHVPDIKSLFRVIRIDLFARRELRLVIGCTYPNGSLHLKRRSLSRITRVAKYFEADAVIAGAAVEDLRQAVMLN